MKKIFALLICIAFFVNFSLVQAKNVRVADEGAENLYQSISQLLINRSIIFSGLQRSADRDFVVGERTFECQFGNYSQPFGEILFCVDSEGYVATIFLCVDFKSGITEQELAYIAGTIHFCLGLSAEEGRKLYFEMNEYDKATGMIFSKVWSSTKNRLFIMSKAESDSSCTYILQATDGKN